MARALKIYRTAIGFHDAYVAAASQKAALEAWGSEKDLFARGAAEVVAETPLADELIANPGVVVKKLRGTVAEQMAALPPTPAKKPRKVEPEPEPAAKTPRKPKPKPAPKPRPSRAKLDEAERAIAAAERRHEAAMRALAEREAALVRERRALTMAQREESAALEDARDAERRAFDAALERWAE
ncbi:hypothetical protein [uncultured Sphingomonas sp.]|uniref:hypothetical protein n=1 Tax=uncultured Sphingomonas sp. TaxID=158754 RepID=UPI0035CA16AA